MNYEVDDRTQRTNVIVFRLDVVLTRCICDQASQVDGHLNICDSRELRDGSIGTDAIVTYAEALEFHGACLHQRIIIST